MLKKIIINIAIVILILFVLDFIIGKTLRYFYFKETSGLHYRTTYSMDSTTADVLIFGSSRANHNYVPEVFEDSLKKTFYNTGRDGNGVFYQEAVIKAILKRYTPKIIIFELSSVFEKGQSEYDQISSLLPYYKDHKEIRSIIELRSPYEKIKMLSQIYPFNSQTLTIGVGNLEINKKRVSDDKGYIALHNKWPYDLDSIADNTIIREVDSNKVNAFKESITSAAKLGIQVFVIYSPLFQKYNKNFEVELCKKICDAEKIPFWDFSKEPDFLADKSLFQDILHLNNTGATKFSKLVVTKINQYNGR